MTQIGFLGAVLVGGSSRRMGRDKALIEVAGVAMAGRVGAALREGGCDRVIAVGPPQLSAGLEAVADRYPGQGPLGAILTALAVADPRPVLVAACDLPWLDAATVRALTAAMPIGSDAAADVVVARSDRLEPLCALWQASARLHLQHAFDSGERAVHRAMHGLRVEEVVVRPAALINVNSPDDLPE